MQIGLPTERQRNRVPVATTAPKIPDVVVRDLHDVRPELPN